MYFSMHAVITLSSIGEYRTYGELYNMKSSWNLIHGSEAPLPISLEAFDKIQASIHSFNGATTQVPLSSTIAAFSVSTPSPAPFSSAKSNPLSPTKSSTSPAKAYLATTSVSLNKASTSPTKATPIFKPARIPPPPVHGGEEMKGASATSLDYMPANLEFIKFIKSNSSVLSKEQVTAGAGAGLSVEDEQDGANVFWAVLWGKCLGVYRGWMQASEASPKCRGLLLSLMEIEANHLFVASYMKGNVYVVED
ncbi:hypothetical protein ARMGADRAFT_1036636 [Armillaria gallica]|uniref:Uncharacterized protein n=1 Tax=Armillaria gallica TaxID=47427 RepID=A0A2H3DA58_ARMGA|nr:hypothetical protein ARMGADRAFT_1036636 [Armillaria gallica]